MRQGEQGRSLRQDAAAAAAHLRADGIPQQHGCKPIGGGKIARANEVCYPTAKDPTNPPGGTSLSGQDFLCYRVKCEQNGGGKTEHDVTDQFGTGTIFANQKPVTKQLCVPAFLGAGPRRRRPAPQGDPDPHSGRDPTDARRYANARSDANTRTDGDAGADPDRGPHADPSPTVIAEPTPTPDPTYGNRGSDPDAHPGGSASLAFVEPVANLLR